VQVKAEEDVAAVEARRRQEAEAQQMQFQHAEARSATAPPPAAAPPVPETYVREGRKVGRNEPCPCGSGQKYKHCHGKLA
jgi:preprotein translocase subunit SecA